MAPTVGLTSDTVVVATKLPIKPSPKLALEPPIESSIKVETDSRDEDIRESPLIRDDDILPHPATLEPASTAEPAPTRTSKRKRTQNDQGPSWRQTPEPPAKAKKKFTYTPDIQRRVMALFLEKARRGSWDVRYGSGLERVRDKLAKEFPTVPWSVQKMREKFRNEQSRYRTWLNFKIRSGVRIDPHTGCLTASEELWEDQLRYDPRSRWLRTLPLVDPDIYGEIFPRESAIVGYVHTAANVSTEGEKDDVSTEGETDDDGDCGDSTSDQDEEPLHEQRREETTDPAMPSESTPTSRRSSSSASAIRRPPTPRIEEATLGAQPLQAVTILARDILGRDILGRNTDTEAIDTASRDLQERFRSSLGALNCLICMEKLQEAREARLWNRLDSEMKQLLVDRWTKEYNSNNNN